MHKILLLSLDSSSLIILPVIYDWNCQASGVIAISDLRMFTAPMVRLGGSWNISIFRLVIIEIITPLMVTTSLLPLAKLTLFRSYSIMETFRDWTPSFCYKQFEACEKFKFILSLGAAWYNQLIFHLPYLCNEKTPNNLFFFKISENVLIFHRTRL